MLLALGEYSDASARAAMQKAILAQGAVRSDKDWRWFAAIRFDADFTMQIDGKCDLGKAKFAVLNPAK